ncbi:MAG: MFS transporter [Treponema sp.]|jgi:DHA3 family macrolide efflux protein-like MFS transporter|nr:MFS transporter [Treponema sp.]
MEINWKKNTALFLIGQTLSFFGTMIVQYAIIWHVTLKSQSGTMMTLFIIAGFLPIIFISPFAGIWADRYNKKYVINIADGAISFFSLIVAIFLICGIENYVILLVCAFARSIGQGVHNPAVSSLIPQIVPKEHLTRINGFQSSIQSAVNLSSPILSGALMTLAPLHTLFFLDVITAIIGISIVLFFVKVPKAEVTENRSPEQKGSTYFHELKEGLEYIKKHSYILLLIILPCIYLFLFTPAGLLKPLQTARNFGADVWRLSAIEIFFWLGTMSGGILIGIWGGFKNRIYTVSLSIFLSGLLALGLGFAPSFWIYIVIMVLLGLVQPLFGAPIMALLQSSVEPAFMGRVMSVVSMSISIINPLGIAVFGPLADKISINTLLIITGILLSLLCIPMLASKTLREAGRSHLQVKTKTVND